MGKGCHTQVAAVPMAAAAAAAAAAVPMAVEAEALVEEMLPPPPPGTPPPQTYRNPCPRAPRPDPILLTGPVDSIPLPISVPNDFVLISSNAAEPLT